MSIPPESVSADRTELLQRVRKYVTHRDNCRLDNSDYQRCTCGLYQLNHDLDVALSVAPQRREGKGERRET